MPLLLTAASKYPTDFLTGHNLPNISSELTFIITKNYIWDYVDVTVSVALECVSGCLPNHYGRAILCHARLFPLHSFARNEVTTRVELSTFWQYYMVILEERREWICGFQHSHYSYDTLVVSKLE